MRRYESVEVLAPAANMRRAFCVRSSPIPAAVHLVFGSGFGDEGLGYR